jgi:hypothetical protein
MTGNTCDLPDLGSWVEIELLEKAFLDRGMTVSEFNEI